LRDTLFVSASLEVFEEPQEVIGNGFSRDFVEGRPYMAADMSLQVRGQTFVQVRFPGWFTRKLSSAALRCLVHFVLCARHFSPAILFVYAVVHGSCPIRFLQ